MAPLEPLEPREAPDPLETLEPMDSLEPTETLDLKDPLDRPEATDSLDLTDRPDSPDPTELPDPMPPTARAHLALLLSLASRPPEDTDVVLKMFRQERVAV